MHLLSRVFTGSYRRRQMWTNIIAHFSPLFLLVCLVKSEYSQYQQMTDQFSNSHSQEGPKTVPLRVVTFNIWLSGIRVSNGLVKIAQQIATLDPDIVALQEVESESVVRNLTELLQMLGQPWTGIWHSSRKCPDTGILTRHKLLQDQLVEVSSGNGVPIVVDMKNASFTVNLFSMHLDYTSYGPYAAQNKMVTKAEQILKGEKPADGKGRVSNIQELLDHPKFKLFLHQAEAQDLPLIVAGDFNCPSHQDWTEETKHLHGGWVFEWPVTKLLTGVGMVDAFREIHSNVLKVPGHTWSTVQKWSGYEWDYSIPEPQDRIDFIFYKGNKEIIKPINSYTYSGKAGDALKAIPDHYENNYPSDHFIVVTDFEVFVKNKD